MKVNLNGNHFFNVTAPFNDINSVHTSPHTGIDLAMPEGTPLFSPTDGIISQIVNHGNENIGKGILIKMDDGKTVIMGHLSEFKVKLGQRVSEGDLIALSGNTGNSTGAHLHLGLKDENDNFIDPEPLVEIYKEFFDTIYIPEGIISNLSNTNVNESVGYFEGAKSFGDFMYKWNESGSFWIAMYGKPFSQVSSEFFSQLFKDIGLFIFGNGDLFFLMPAIVFMFATFFVGRNRFTKWILPLWFAYFVSSVTHHLIK